MKFRQHTQLFFTIILTTVFSTAALSQSPVGGKDQENDPIKALQEVARAAERKGDFTAATEAYNRILAIDPHSYPGHAGLVGIGKQIVMREYQGNPGFGSDEKLMKEIADKLKAEALVKQAKYEKLAKDNPTKAAYPLILANSNSYEPLKMQEYLYQAQRIEPDNAEVLRQVAQFEKLKGNNAKASEIFKRISDLEPEDENAAFAYYYSLADVDEDRFRSGTREFLKRFPSSERGATLLSQIAEKQAGSDRAASLEALRKAFPPDKNQTSMSAMGDLYSIYLGSSPDKALSFAKEILALAPESRKKDWQGNIDFITSYKEAESLINQNKGAEALLVLEKIKLPARSAATSESTVLLNLLKAKAQSVTGQNASAYDGLMSFYVKSPSDEVRRELTKIGAALGKNDVQVKNEIQTAVAKLAEPFKDFSLGLYDQNKNVSLADYRGKVILLNFWYPLCGPCHAEAPYIQRLVEKFGKDKFVVLAPNAFPNQDSLVVPFFQGNKYDFVPLKVPDADYLRKEYQVRGYPTNYLIDKKGNKVYQTGNVTRQRLRQIELMIETLLAQQS